LGNKVFAVLKKLGLKTGENGSLGDYASETAENHQEKTKDGTKCAKTGRYQGTYVQNLHDKMHNNTMRSLNSPMPSKYQGSPVQNLAKTSKHQRNHVENLTKTCKYQRTCVQNRHNKAQNLQIELTNVKYHKNQVQNLTKTGKYKRN
jgi:hypothetical protein